MFSCAWLKKLGIPVVTGADSIDCIYDEHPLYIGKGGNVGDRPAQLRDPEQRSSAVARKPSEFPPAGYRFTT
ncbi:MAG: hypothetical protein ACLR8P_16430 [Clostridium fessum]